MRFFRSVAWLRLALELLELNKIDAKEFAKAIRSLFEKERWKYTNLILTGPSNCGKSFLFDVLEIAFGEQCFTSPARTRFSWAGVDEADVIYLNDFRWSAELIEWSDLLRLLEGATVKLPLPRNFYKSDLVLPRTNKVPIFATSKGRVEFVNTLGAVDDIETGMMKTRWTPYDFTHVFREDEVEECPPCPACFCTLVFDQ